MCVILKNKSFVRSSETIRYPFLIKKQSMLVKDEDIVQPYVRT
jgi:hypothetical protein